MKGQRYGQELARGKKILFSSKAQDIDHAANARPEESAHERLFDPGHVGGRGRDMAGVVVRVCGAPMGKVR